MWITVQIQEGPLRIAHVVMHAIQGLAHPVTGSLHICMACGDFMSFCINWLYKASLPSIHAVMEGAMCAGVPSGSCWPIYLQVVRAALLIAVRML